MSRVASVLALPALLFAAAPATAGSMAELGAAMSTNSALQSSSAPSAAKTLKGVQGKMADINAKQSAKVAALDDAAGPGGGKSKGGGRHASSSSGWAANDGRSRSSAWASGGETDRGGAWAKRGEAQNKKKPTRR